MSDLSESPAGIPLVPNQTSSFGRMTALLVSFIVLVNDGSGNGAGPSSVLNFEARPFAVATSVLIFSEMLALTKASTEKMTMTKPAMTAIVPYKRIGLRATRGSAQDFKLSTDTGLTSTASVVSALRSLAPVDPRDP